MTGGWLRRWEPAAVAVSLLVVAVLIWQVHTGGGVVRLDDRVFARVGVVASPWATAISALGSPELSAVVLGVAALHHAFFAGRWWPIALAAANGATAGLVVLVIKALTARRGPGQLPLDGYPGYFPSGHTVTAAVCFGTATYIVRRGRVTVTRAEDTAVVVGLSVGVAVGTATVLTGNHWLSDVIGGLALAVVLQVLGFAVLRRRLDGRNLSERRRRLVA